MLMFWIDFLARLRLWRQRKRTRTLLASFDDRMLKDIGLSPADVRREASKPFWKQ
ncbi:MAG: DUF1127 domain-containing protein [Ochrobactrum anthropi]|uniref:DUF1127 domain-containing protein n=1 Tax=Brucella anthropi TaxID=529 RepID=A0A8I0TAS8_BRUAN|nr:DUF1127 domain-containing protein [Brucella anthropi]